MPTLATGTWTNNPPPYGFTLLEVMITLVLIGIITSLAVLSVGASGGGERLATEARRLAALIELNHQEAILRGEQRGVRFIRGGYQFLTLGEKGQWRPVTDSALLRRHRLPRDLRLQVRVEGEPITLNSISPRPQIFLFSTGEASDFEATLSTAQNQAYTIAGNTLGRLSVEWVQ